MTGRLDGAGEGLCEGEPDLGRGIVEQAGKRGLRLGPGLLIHGGIKIAKRKRAHALSPLAGGNHPGPCKKTAHNHQTNSPRPLRIKGLSHKGRAATIAFLWLMGA